MTPGGFHAFEHQWAMAAAFDMHEAMGRARVAARIRSLNDQLKASLAENRKIRVHTPMSGDLSAGLVAFEVDGLKPRGRGEAPARAEDHRQHQPVRRQLCAARPEPGQHARRSGTRRARGARAHRVNATEEVPQNRPS